MKIVSPAASFLLFFFSLAYGTIPLDNPEDCLLNPLISSPHQVPCHLKAYDLACLTAVIPEDASLDQISQCFHCCLSHWSYRPAGNATNLLMTASPPFLFEKGSFGDIDSLLTHIPGRIELRYEHVATPQLVRLKLNSIHRLVQLAMERFKAITTESRSSPHQVISLLILMDQPAAAGNENERKQLKDTLRFLSRIFAVKAVFLHGGRHSGENVSSLLADLQSMRAFSVTSLPRYSDDGLSDRMNSKMLSSLNPSEYSSSRSLKQAFVPYWLHEMMPIAELRQHYGRGRSRCLEFQKVYLPRLFDELYSTTRSQMSIVVSSAKAVRLPALEEMCSLTSHQKALFRRHQEAHDHRQWKQDVVPLIPTTRPPLLEIVLPRCCELVSSDLAWIHLLHRMLKQTLSRISNGSVTISVYYKCPHCLPASKLAPWGQRAADLLSQQQQASADRTWSAANISHSASNSRGAVPRGVRLIDELPGLTESAGGSSPLVIREFESFDNIQVNGKEATAYLRHIVQHYEKVAWHTIFLHTQPAHHLDFTRFNRLLQYIFFCTTSLDDPDAKAKRHNNQLDFLYLNYRHFEGHWAHQPERCNLEILNHMFSNSSAFGDEKRAFITKGGEPDVSRFLNTKMAAGVAAQFVASRFAIQRRPLDYWKRLLAVNEEAKLVPECTNGDNLEESLRGNKEAEQQEEARKEGRASLKTEVSASTSELQSNKYGSEAASAMERLWHNFFDDGQSRANPLYLPFILEDPNIPAYLQVHSGANIGLESEAVVGERATAATRDQHHRHHRPQSISDTAAGSQLQQFRRNKVNRLSPPKPAN